MNIIKQTHSKNNKEIVLIEKDSSNIVGQVCPTYAVDYCNSRSGIPARQQKTILIIGVVHGDEPQGKFLIENYLNQEKHMLKTPRPLGERVSEARVRGKNRLLFIPCLNPDGLELNTRQNSNKVDINRNFPTKNWGINVSENPDYFGGKTSASEIETKFVIDIIEEFKPDVILTLHAPYKVVNYDGPAKNIAEKISEIINYPTSIDIGYPTPGSFGTYAGVERNIPTITLELDEEIDVEDLVEPVNKIFDYLSFSDI